MPRRSKAPAELPFFRAFRGWYAALVLALALAAPAGCTLHREKPPAPDPPPLGGTEKPIATAPTAGAGMPAANSARQRVGPSHPPAPHAEPAPPAPHAKPPPPARPALASLQPPPAVSAEPALPDSGAQPYDPVRPCLTRQDANRAERTLLNGSTRGDGEQWLRALNQVFFEIKVDCRDTDFLVLVLSTIQQESGVTVDPWLENRNLEDLLEFRLARLGDRNPVLRGALDASGIEKALRAKVRLDQKRGTVRSEGDLARYVTGDLRPWMRKYLEKNFSLPEGLAQMAAEIGLPNPVKTLGPLQVNLDKAFRNARARGDPVATPEAMQIRLLHPATALVDGLREGVYLLWGPYRFYRQHLPAEQGVLFAGADFNAGEFSSRNAAFQERAAALSGRGLTLDGDLLLYRDGRPLLLASNTERAVREALRGTEPGPIRQDLLLEKKGGFYQTTTARRLCERFRRAEKKPCAVARLPEGAVNRTAAIKLGRAYTPANYGHALLRRFQQNRETFGQP